MHARFFTGFKNYIYTWLNSLPGCVPLVTAWCNSPNYMAGLANASDEVAHDDIIVIFSFLVMRLSLPLVPALWHVPTGPPVCLLRCGASLRHHPLCRCLWSAGADEAITKH